MNEMTLLSQFLGLGKHGIYQKDFAKDITIFQELPQEILIVVGGTMPIFLS